MIKSYPKIQAFKNVAKLVDKNYLDPIVEYEGTVKLHGTNASVVYGVDGTIQYQSRNNNITPDNDNAGFARWASENDVLNDLRVDEPSITTILFGEWCGGNIQAGVALNQLPKMFVIFNICFISSTNTVYEPATYGDDFLKAANLNGIYFINQFKTYKTTVDFSSTISKQAFAEYAALVTEKVGDECPVGSALGVKGLGEGIVWKPTSIDNSDLWIKTKDPRHSKSKVKEIVPLTEEEFAEISKIEDFCTRTVNEGRVKQAIAEFSESKKDIGNVIRWVYYDILLEEADLITANNLNAKKLGKPISDMVRPILLKLIEGV